MNPREKLAARKRELAEFRALAKDVGLIFLFCLTMAAFWLAA